MGTTSRRQASIAGLIALLGVLDADDLIQSRADRGLRAAERRAVDPGVRGGRPGAGGPYPELDQYPAEMALFSAGESTFQDVDSVQGELYFAGTEPGLGPQFNAESCATCHIQPTLGGSSPAKNPLRALAEFAGAANRLPPFITPRGPIREARFKYKADGTRDGAVHRLFTIAGRTDAPGCALEQPDFERALAHNNVALRIPTPTFGAGLIEAIPDSVILSNRDASRPAKRYLGISGHANRDASRAVGRFGWKAQQRLLETFSAEAYNVEQGVTTPLFPNDLETPPASCVFTTNPESLPDLSTGDPMDALGDPALFAGFMRFLAAPVPVNQDRPSVRRGRAVFEEVGCALCHTPALTTDQTANPALANQQVNLYSDLLVHRMGPGLADDIIQGKAGPDEFRTAPLWGLGQRIFFLHDGRTRDLVVAIEGHASEGNRRFGPSEANRVIENFRGLSASEAQDLLNFLRSL